METKHGEPKIISTTATGSGVPRIQDPPYHFDESNHWVFDIPQDVQQYLKSQFGEDVVI